MEKYIDADFYLSWAGNNWKEFVEGMEKACIEYDSWMESDEDDNLCPTAEIHTKHGYKLYFEFGPDGKLEYVEAMDF